MKNNSVLIIGAGLGGLTVGIRLAAEGFRVRILEKNDTAGGWLRPTRFRNFCFPNAGNLLTMPDQFRELFDCVGRPMEEYLTLNEISPVLQFCFPSGNDFTFYRESAELLMKNPLFGLADQQAYSSYGKRSDFILDEVKKNFFSAPLQERRNPFTPEFGFRSLRPDRSGAATCKKMFSSEELRAVYAFWPVFCGGMPSGSSHFYRMIPAALQRWGTYTVDGGPEALVNALLRLFWECGGELQYNAEVEAVQIYNGTVTGVRLRDNSVRQADIVISDADTAFTCREMIDTDRLRYAMVDRAARRLPGPSVFIYHMAFRTPPKEKRPYLGMNLLIPEDRNAWEQDLFVRRQLPEEPLLFLNFPGKLYPENVPEGCGAMTAICPVPNLEAEIDWPKESYRFREHLLDRLQPFFENDLRADLVGERCLTPADLKIGMNLYQGAAWGFSPNQPKTDLPRLANRSEDIKNLYFVGNGAHPGPFLPAVLQSAALVYQDILSRRSN